MLDGRSWTGIILQILKRRSLTTFPLPIPQRLVAGNDTLELVWAMDVDAEQSHQVTVAEPWLSQQFYLSYTRLSTTI